MRDPVNARIHKKLSSVFFLLFISGAACGHGLVEDIYSHAKSDPPTISAASFVALSNLYLSEQQLAVIEADYLKETNPEKKYYYEYLLSKRTQQQNYINAFVESSNAHLKLLSDNHTNWVSISSPFYQQVAIYSRTNDDALRLLFLLTKVSDGAPLAVIAEDLSEIRRRDPKRFLKIEKKSGVDQSYILDLMEDE